MEREIQAFVRPSVEVILEQGEHNWGAYAPAFPGAVGIGDTALEAQQSVELSLSLVFEEMQRVSEQAAGADSKPVQAGD